MNIFYGYFIVDKLIWHMNKIKTLICQGTKAPQTLHLESLTFPTNIDLLLFAISASVSSSVICASTKIK